MKQMRLLVAICVAVFAILAVKAAFASGAIFAPCPGQKHVVITASLNDCDDAMGQCSHDRCKGGKCVCPYCAAAGASILPAPGFILHQTTGASLVAIPTGSLRDGITVRPVTGPPRLTA
jgi:hypothetical protein